MHLIKASAQFSHNLQGQVIVKKSVEDKERFFSIEFMSYLKQHFVCIFSDVLIVLNCIV